MNKYEEVKIDNNVNLYWKTSNYKRKDGTEGELKQLVLRVKRADPLDPNCYTVQEINLSNQYNYKSLLSVYYNSSK